MPSKINGFCYFTKLITKKFNSAVVGLLNAEVEFTRLGKYLTLIVQRYCQICIFGGSSVTKDLITFTLNRIDLSFGKLIKFFFSCTL